MSPAPYNNKCFAIERGKISFGNLTEDQQLKKDSIVHHILHILSWEWVIPKAKALMKTDWTHLRDQEHRREIAGKKNPYYLVHRILARQQEAFLFFRSLKTP